MTLFYMTRTFSFLHFSCYGMRSDMLQIKERKGKERKRILYSAFYILCISQSAQAWITQFFQRL